MVGGKPDGSPFCQLLFRVHHLVGTVSQEELCLSVPLRPGDHQLAPQLFQKTGGFQGALEVVADGDNAHIKVPDPQGGKEDLVGAVPDLAVGSVGQHFIEPLLVGIYHHDLVAQIVQLHGNVLAEPAQAKAKTDFSGI